MANGKGRKGLRAAFLSSKDRRKRARVEWTAPDGETYEVEIVEPTSKQRGQIRRAAMKMKGDEIEFDQTALEVWAVTMCAHDPQILVEFLLALGLLHTTVQFDLDAHAGTQTTFCGHGYIVGIITEHPIGLDDGPVEVVLAPIGGKQRPGPWNPRELITSFMDEASDIPYHTGEPVFDAADYEALLEVGSRQLDVLARPAMRYLGNSPEVEAKN